MKERLFWIGCIILIILYFTKCNQKACPVIKDVKYDTTYIQGKDSIAWKTPKAILIPGETKTDTFIEYSITTMAVDTLAILADYFKVRYYEDTNRVQYGTTIIKDSITQNKILRRKIITDWEIPVVTKTVTYMQPKKSEIYAGLNFGYNNVGANLIFKDTSNRIWEAGAFYQGKMFYYIGRKWKIK